MRGRLQRRHKGAVQRLGRAQRDLYFFLIRINRNSHRFLTIRILFEGLAPNYIRKGATMLDFVLLALGIGLFALSIGYAYACDRL
jgi:hypothetical protein